MAINHFFFVTGKIIQSSQQLKRWIILIYKSICHSKDKIFVIVASGMLIIVIGLILYGVTENLHETTEVDKELEYGHAVGNHSVFYKKDWNGLGYTRTVKMPHPVGLVIVSETKSVPCFSFSKCSHVLREVQKLGMDKGQWDIGANFLIGGDGNIYVGRGWDTINNHAHLSIGVAFIGNYNIDELNKSMTDAALKLLHQGVRLGKLSKDYVLIGLNQSCRNVADGPGENIHKVIKTWKHFSNITIYNSSERNPFMALETRIECFDHVD